MVLLDYARWLDKLQCNSEYNHEAGLEEYLKYREKRLRETP